MTDIDCGCTIDDRSCRCDDLQEEIPLEEMTTQDLAAAMMVPHVLILLTDLVGIAWISITLLWNGAFSEQGISFSDWKKAGTTIIWLGGLLVSVLEMVFWFISWAGGFAWFAYLQYSYFFGFIGSIAIEAFPVIFFILANVIDEVALTGDFLILFMVQIGIWIFLSVFHAIYTNQLWTYTAAV